MLITNLSDLGGCEVKIYTSKGAEGLSFGPDGKVSIRFDNPDNPTEADLDMFHNNTVVSDFFELKDGKISVRFVPIRDRIKDPEGRTDYGWNDEKRRQHLKSAYSRGWKHFPFRMAPHDGVMHIVGGGPSLRKCLPALRKLAKKKKHFVLSVNKSHDFLLNLPKLGLGEPIKSWGAALLDPCDWVKDYITPRPGVQYFIGDQCAPATFDVFDKDGISKWIWRATNPTKDRDITPQSHPYIGGGSTVGLRMRTFSYMCGFRHIHYWGFDSSAEVTDDAPEGKMHGYEKIDSVGDRVKIKATDEHGFEQTFTTNTHMGRQAQEYIDIRDNWIKGTQARKYQWIYETFHGEGLLPTIAARLGLHSDPKRNCTTDMHKLIPDGHAITPGPSEQGGQHAA